jgi:hypothetical protein
MPVQFAYHQTSDEVAHDIRDGAPLTPEEAQVIATLSLTQAVESVA